MFKKLLLALIIASLMCSCATAGNTTTNSYFYLPGLGAVGNTERNQWFTAFQNTDAVLHGMRSALYWTNGTNSTLTGEVDLESSNLDITGIWNFAGSLTILPSGAALVTTDCDAAAEAGRVFIDTDATSGQQLYVCEGLAGWVLQSGGGGGAVAAGWTDGGTTVYNTTTTDSIGIGTTEATGILDVRGDEVRIWTGSGTNDGATSPGELYVEGDIESDGFFRGNGSLLTGIGASSGGWTDAGTTISNTALTDKVGIGTSAPTEILEVTGNIKVNGSGGSKDFGGTYGFIDFQTVDKVQLGITSKEDVLFDLGTAANKAVLSSTTGVVSFDFANLLPRISGGTTLPGTCNQREIYFDTDAVAGSNLFGCTATNTWKQLGGSGGGGSTTGWGNIIYVDQSDSIATAISNATAGDTLVLDSGNYNFATQLAINKALTIVGQGAGRTTLTNSSALTIPVYITASNVTIKDLSVIVSGSTALYAIHADGTAGTVLSNVRVENVLITMSPEGSFRGGIFYNDASGIIRNPHITASGGSANGLGIYLRNSATAEAATLLQVYNPYIFATSGVSSDIGWGIVSEDSSATTASVVEVYGGRIIVRESGTGTSYGVATFVGADSSINVYGTTLDATDFDAASVSSGGPITLYNTTLVNGTTSGTITLAGRDTSGGSTINGTQIISSATATAVDLVNLSGTALTSGNVLDVSSSSTGQTVPMVSMTQSGTSYAGLGVLNVSLTGASATGPAFVVNDSGADTTPFTIDASGNTGIGTTAPSTNLHVVGGARVTGLVSCDTIDTNASGVMVCGTDASGGGGGGGTLSNVVEDLTPQLGGDLDVNGKQLTSVSNGNIQINPNGTGKVGIGTTVPSALLSVGTAFTVDSAGLMTLPNANVSKAADGVDIVSITNSDTDVASDSYNLVIKQNDTADANAGYIKLVDDADGTPTNLVTITQTAAVFNLPTSFGSSGTGSMALGTAGVVLSDDGDGALTILGAGNGSDEDLTLNLDDTSNVGTFTSSTSLATLNFSSIDLQVPTEVYDATGWNGDNTVPTKDAVRDKIETLGGGGGTWDALGDSVADGSIAQAGFEQDITSTLDSAGKSVLTITNTDADVAAATSMIELKHNDAFDTDFTWFKASGDLDGTPSDDVIFKQDGNYFRANVGIGTTVPAAPIHVKGTDSDVRIEGTSNSAFNEISMWNDGGETLTFGASGTAASGGLRSYMNMVQNGPLTISTNDTARITIEGDGDIGIGTTAPISGAKLDVRGIIIPTKVTADPCSSGAPAGGIFYNSTSNYMCYCNGTNDVKMSDDTTACF